MRFAPPVPISPPPLSTPFLPAIASMALAYIYHPLPADTPCICTTTKWTETVQAGDYIDFLNVLWERVRPDLLFEPLSQTADEASPETVSPNIRQKRLPPKGRPQGGAARRQSNRSNSRRRSVADSGVTTAASSTAGGTTVTKAPQSEVFDDTGGGASVAGIAR